MTQTATFEVVATYCNGVKVDPTASLPPDSLELLGRGQHKPAKKPRPVLRERIHSAYLDEAFDPFKLRRIIRRCVRKLKPHAAEFDAIVCRGTSGLLVGPGVAIGLGKPVIVVRKPDDRAHTQRSAEGALEVRRYCIVDDLICTGDTIRKTVAAIEEAWSNWVGRYTDAGLNGEYAGPICWGICLWKDSCTHEGSTWEFRNGSNLKHLSAYPRRTGW